MSGCSERFPDDRRRAARSACLCLPSGGREAWPGPAESTQPRPVRASHQVKPTRVSDRICSGRLGVGDSLHDPKSLGRSGAFRSLRLPQEPSAAPLGMDLPRGAASSGAAAPNLPQVSSSCWSCADALNLGSADTPEIFTTCQRWDGWLPLLFSFFLRGGEEEEPPATVAANAGSLVANASGIFGSIRLSCRLSSQPAGGRHLHPLPVLG